MRVRLNVFGSRVAWRVFASFMLAALVPLVALSMLVLTQVGSTLEARAYDQLGTSSRAYGQFVLDKLVSAANVLSSIGDASGDSPTEVRIPGLLRVVAEPLPAAHARGAADFESPLSPERPVLSVEHDASALRITLAAATYGETFYGEIDPDYLWAASGVIGNNMEVCVFAAGDVGALHCSGGDAAPAPIAQLIRQTHASSGRLEWREGNTKWLTAYWQLFIGSRFVGEPWYIVVSEPRAEALSTLAAFDRVIPQVVALSAALIVLLSIAQVRRTLGPLKQLLVGTKRIGARDFTARVEISTDDEFGALGEAMNTMAGRLGQQFDTLKTLAEIDSLILSAEEIDRVLETVLEHAHSLVPGGSVSVLLIDLEDLARGRLYRRMPSATGGVALQRIAIAAALRTALASHPSGWFAEQAALADLGLAPLLDDGDAAGPLHVMPLVHGGDVAGALLSSLPSGTQTGGDIAVLEELAGRLSVALAAGQREQELFRRAHFDGLTGLPNRQLCNDRLRQALAQARRDSHGLAVLFVDLDGFKNVNDSVGHWAGDELLCETALRLTTVVRDGDTVARLGGDEYAVILPHIHSPIDAETVAANILQVIARPFMVEEHELFVTASVGVTLFPEDGTTAEELLRKADTAMYSAKDTGRARAVFFAGEMDERVRQRHELTNDLRAALEHGEFFLVYQPQVAFRDRRVVGVEALLRWRHPKRGLISPAAFVPVLEEIGLIEEVGRWVIERALHDYSEWLRRGVPVGRIAVNVTARQLLGGQFVAFVAEALRAAGLTGDCLEVELTEATLVVDAAAANVKLKELAGLGARIALDDFGTGYSSLGYLNELVFDTLKIDRAFVINLPDERSTAIVRAILAVAKALGKEVVAEGIESELQLSQLEVLGCDIAQGYFFSRPLESEALREWLCGHEMSRLDTVRDGGAERLFADESSRR